MQSSEIVVPQSQDESATPNPRVKLRQAYITARRSLQLTDIELNRSKVVVIDENGKILRFSLTSEH